VSEPARARSQSWRPSLAAPIVALATGLLVADGLRPVPQLDDAYISYRYAANLAAGEGLVYNPGQRVEGFTSPLHTLLVAGGIRAGAPAPLVGHALGVLGGAAAIGLAYAYAAVGLPRRRRLVAALAPCLVLASTPVALWSTSGMETMLFAALVTGALALGAAGRTGAAVTVAAAATLTRPEGGLVAAAILAPGILRGPRADRRAWLAAAAFAGFVLAVTALRLAYYGQPLPNTFYAKVGGVSPWRGVRYLADFLRAGPALLLLPAALAAARDARFRPGALLCVLFAAYVVAVGGDAFAHGRFLVPVLPALAALAARGVEEAFRIRPWAGAAAAGLALLAIPWQLAGPPPFRWDRRAGIEQKVHARRAILEHMGRERARVLRRRGGDVDLVAGAAIGSLGFYSGLRVVDVYGLVSPEIARSRTSAPEGTRAIPGHHRSDADFVFSLEPDYVLVPERGHPSSRHIPATRDLWDHPALARDYVWDPEVWGYRRRSQAGR